MYICDRCLTPFHSYDCDPEIVPPGDDWSELCPQCQDRRAYYMRLEAEPTDDEIDRAQAFMLHVLGVTEEEMLK